MNIVHQQTYFESKYLTLLAQGVSFDDASFEVIEAYLAGKPIKDKKQKEVNKNQLFWSSRFLCDVSVDVLNSETFILTLAKYFSQENTSHFSLLEHITRLAPEAMRKAIRGSEIVLRPKSGKWIEVKQLAERIPDELADLIKICKQFQVSHKQRIDLLAEYQSPFQELSLFELLSYSSLYAFKHFVVQPIALDGEVITTSEQFQALKSILEWKLSITEKSSFHLTDRSIAESLKIHQTPIIFPSNEDSSTPDRYLHLFEKLMQTQVELDGFLSRSIVPFCFDEDTRYDLNGSQLVLTVIDEKGKETWDSNGKKLNRLDGYWLQRGRDEFVAMGMANKIIGCPENHEYNQTAYIKAIGAFLQLQEVYGLDKTVLTDSGMKVDIFQALLSLELMIAFYNKDYIQVFFNKYEKAGEWQLGLGMLAMSGLIGHDHNDLHNRFPITWSNWKQKAKSIVGWTVCDVFPEGSLKGAEAILDFWSLDFKKHCVDLQSNNTANLPGLTERPIFKLGNYSVQLPWMMAQQLTGVNVINTLRRFANKRSELKDETSRIETNLGNKFKERGFKVIESYHPERREGFNPGEIDLICVLDSTVLVLEVKSTYRRNSKREVIGYKNNALRKAGIQIKRKVKAVEQLLHHDDKLKSLLGIEYAYNCNVIGWIADTCVEFDHEDFNGFLKVSVEELHIALSNDADLLVDIMDLGLQADKDENSTSLYPNGFCAAAFVEVIEQGRIWA